MATRPRWLVRGAATARTSGRSWSAAARLGSSRRRTSQEQPSTHSCHELMRAVIAEDSVLLREGLIRLLSEAQIEVVGQAGDAEDLLRKTRAHKPDVVITDIRMPPTQSDEGLRAAQIIRGELPGTGVLVLSQYIEEQYVMELLSDSADGVGYLLKDRVADVGRFVEAVQRV